MIDCWIDLEGDFDRFFVDFWFESSHGKPQKNQKKNIGFLKVFGCFHFFHCCVVGLPSWSIFGRFWVDLGGQNRSKIDQNWLKNQDKNQSKKWLDFWSIFDGFGVDFGRVLGAKIGQKSIKMGCQKWLKNWWKKSYAALRGVTQAK